MSARHRSVAGWGGVAAVALTAVFAILGGFSPKSSSGKFLPPLDKARDDRGRLVPDNCRAHGKQIDPLVCVYGDVKSDRRVVLFGDSHALQWGPAIIRLAEKRGWKLYTLLRAGCPIANVATARNCSKWRGRSIHRIHRINPKHIIISTSTGHRYRIKHKGRNLTRKASEGRLRAGMVRTIRKLKRVKGLSGNKNEIKLIRDQILAPFVPADCLRKNGGREDRCSFRNKRKYGPGFDWVAAKRTGILPAVDPTRALCGPKWCSPTKKGKILKYRDRDHITATYARTLTGWFGKRLGIP